MNGGRLVWAMLALFLSGCATPPPTTPAASAPVEAVTPPAAAPAPGVKLRQFAGRLSITIESEPAQRMSAEFELEGDESAGELRLYAPIVGLVAVLQWEPGRAVLIEGERRRVVRGIDWLIERVTGAPIPLSMLFSWLNGLPVQSDDWWFETRERPNDRYRAVRLQPLPRIELVMAVTQAAP